MKLIVETWPIEKLVPYGRNPRRNDEQVDRMAGAIREFGFRIPVVAKSDGAVVDGHLRLKAARKLGMKEVPVALADELTDVQVKAFRILANQSANWAEWDDDLLKLELEELSLVEYDLSLTGFSEDELNVHLNGWESDIEIPEGNGHAEEQGVIRVKVELQAESAAREAIAAALQEKGIQYAF